MRTIEEIKEGITTEFMENRSVADLYGFSVGANFAEHFSAVSLVNLLFYICAAAAWVTESLFDKHKEEVEENLSSKIPHRPKWYRNKVLNFMKDEFLITDTDIYDTSNMTEADINQCKVVKHAVAVELPDSSALMIKVAGESNGVRGKLDETTIAQLSAYVSEIKDAGVRVDLINMDPDVFNCDVDIYYNPLSPTNIKETCEKEIKKYIENLPFNGEYTNMALVDVLQAIAGVVIVEFNYATTSVTGGEVVTTINARHTPAAGYYKTGLITINTIAYE